MNLIIPHVGRIDANEVTKQDMFLYNVLIQLCSQLPNVLIPRQAYLITL